MRFLAPGIVLTVFAFASSTCSKPSKTEEKSRPQPTQADEVVSTDLTDAETEPVPDKQLIAGTSASRPMMVEFSRDYCTPCQVMKPWVAEIADENPSVDVLTVNVDRKKYEHIGSFFKVTAVPSLLFVGPDGQVVRRSDGLANKEQMTKALRELGWAR